MELSVVNRVNMSLGLLEFLHPHVALDCQHVLSTIPVQKCHLLPSVQDHKVAACCVERKVSYGVPCKGLNNTKTIHVFVHSVEIPQPDMII